MRNIIKFSFFLIRWKIHVINSSTNQIHPRCTSVLPFIDSLFLFFPSLNLDIHSWKLPSSIAALLELLLLIFPQLRVHSDSPFFKLSFRFILPFSFSFLDFFSISDVQFILWIDSSSVLAQIFSRKILATFLGLFSRKIVVSFLFGWWENFAPLQFWKWRCCSCF